MGLAVSLITETNLDLEDLYEDLDGIRYNFLLEGGSIETFMQEVAEQLCSTCVTMDLYQLFFRKVEIKRGNTVRVFSSRMFSWKEDECPLCRLFAAVTKSKYQRRNIFDWMKRRDGISSRQRIPKLGLNPVDMKEANV